MAIVSFYGNDYVILDEDLEDLYESEGDDAVIMLPDGTSVRIMAWDERKPRRPRTFRKIKVLLL